MTQFELRFGYIVNYIGAGTSLIFSEESPGPGKTIPANGRGLRK